MSFLEKLNSALWWVPIAWPMVATGYEFLTTGVWIPVYGIDAPGAAIYWLYTVL